MYGFYVFGGIDDFDNFVICNFGCLLIWLIVRFEVVCFGDCFDGKEID